MWDHQHLTAVSASKACHGDSFAFLLVISVAIFPLIRPVSQASKSSEPMRVGAIPLLLLCKPYITGVSIDGSFWSQCDCDCDFDLGLILGSPRLEVSWCRAQIWDFWPEFFFKSYCLVIFGAPSLTRGRVCHVSVFVIEVYSSLSLSTKYLLLHYSLQCWTHLQYNKIFTIYTGLVQSRLCTADYALLTGYLVYHGSLRHLNSRTHDRRQVWASYIFCVGSRLVQCCEHFHFHDFGWLLLVACMILLCLWLHTTDPFSRQRGCHKKKNKVTVKRKKKSKIKSGHGSQREARYQDELVDCLSVARRTPNSGLPSHFLHSGSLHGRFPTLKMEVIRFFETPQRDVSWSYLGREAAQSSSRAGISQ
jgi:hypothetical protein